MDERAARIIVVPGDSRRIVTVGWEVRDHAALARVQDAVGRRRDRRQAAVAGRGRRTARRGGHHVRRPGGHRDRGLPRRGPRPQPGGHPVRRQVRHRGAGPRPRRAAGDGLSAARSTSTPRCSASCRAARSACRRRRSSARCACASSASTSATTAWRCARRRTAARPRPDPPHGGGRHRSTPSARRSTGSTRTASRCPRPWAATPTTRWCRSTCAPPATGTSSSAPRA